MSRAQNHRPATGGADLGFPDEMARIALEHTPIEVYWLDLAGHILDVNHSAIQALGYSRDELVGLCIWEIDVGCSPEQWTSFVEDLRRMGDHVHLESFHRRRDGSLYPIEVTAFLVEVRDDPLICGFAQDISVRRQAEEALQASEERLRTLINATPDIICFKDGQGRWLETNNANLELFSLKDLDYRGKLDRELADETHPCYREAFLTCEISDERAWESGRLSHGEEVIPRPDGSVRVYDVIKVPVFEPDGQRRGLVVLGRDITERKQAEEALREERLFLQAVLDSIEDPIRVIGADYRLLRMNQAAYQLIAALGEEGQLHCTSCQGEAKSNQRYCFAQLDECPMRLVYKTHRPAKFIRRHRFPSGAEVQYEVIANPLFGEDDKVCAIIEVSHNISEHLALLDALRAREQSYVHLAYHDHLTGLPNRLLFTERLNQAIHAAHRQGRHFAVLFIDLDRFKQVNDSFDHSYGDRLLVAVAKRLQGILREDDTLARLGGDEFMVILSDIKQAEDAATVATKILKQLRQPFEIQGHQILLGASIGISLYPEHGTTVDDLVRNADAAMYRAKEGGRNSFQYYSEELTARVLERVLLESNLHYALDRGELYLHYQPQYELKTGRLRGIEALVRWQHPKLGAISPAIFIPVAEESALILALGEWVLATACRQMHSWCERGLIPRETLLSVNLSPKQLDQPDLVERIGRILDDSGLPASQLELEITESALMRAPAQAADLLLSLRKLGVKLAIDDFGTGYSSLIQIKRLPLTTLKIDRSFISDLPNDVNDIAISRAVIALAQALCLEVLAEGIETEAQRDFLVQEGCLNGQGYLLARPLDVQGIESLLRPSHASGHSIPIGDCDIPRG